VEGRWRIEEKRGEKDEGRGGGGGKARGRRRE
jgi:hypothetical protein